MNIRYIVDLTEEECQALTEMTRKGAQNARRIKRAHILLMANEDFTDEAIAAAIMVGTSTVYRTKRKMVEGGLEHALAEAKRPGGERKLDVKQEATLVALACTKPPLGRSRWTMQLLADSLVALVEEVDSLSAETVRRRLNENDLKPWQQRMWCIPKFDADYIANMEDVLDLYAQPREADAPMVCFDETFTQLVQETRTPIPAKPGSTECIDYEYRRNGTANLFMFVAPWERWRHVKITERKGNADFAECMRDLVDVHFPDAPLIRVVLDNLSTHRPGALYSHLPPQEARRILRRIEFHYTPKHGSWLNMAEIEIGILGRQCLDRRIPDRDALHQEVAAWERARNADDVGIDWMFDLETARRKLARAYEKVKPASSADPVASKAA